MILFAKPNLLLRLRLRACTRVVHAAALLLAMALVAAGFPAAATLPGALVPQDAATGSGHCADHLAATDVAATQDQHASHAGGCCNAICACACTHAIASVPLLVLRWEMPAVRIAAFDPAPACATLAAPPLRPPIA